MQALVLCLALWRAGVPSAASQAPASLACRAETTAVALRELPEASGIAVSHRDPSQTWAHNDSGDPDLYSLNRDGGVTGRVRLSGVTPEDWEDLAVGPCPGGWCLYAADIGDNNAARRDIAVYRVPEPAANATTTAQPETFRATYPDGPRDAEALIVTGAGRMYIVSKGENSGIALYRFPPNPRPGTTSRLERVGAAFTDGRVQQDARITGAALSPDGQWVALRTHNAVMLFRAEAFLEGSWREETRVDVSGLREPQGEGVAIAPGNMILVVGEGARSGTFSRLACPQIR
jgi:hypothetical protein